MRLPGRRCPSIGAARYNFYAVKTMSSLPALCRCNSRCNLECNLVLGCAILGEPRRGNMFCICPGGRPVEKSPRDLQNGDFSTGLQPGFLPYSCTTVYIAVQPSCDTAVRKYSRISDDGTAVRMSRVEAEFGLGLRGWSKVTKLIRTAVPSSVYRVQITRTKLYISSKYLLPPQRRLRRFLGVTLTGDLVEEADGGLRSCPIPF